MRKLAIGIIGAIAAAGALYYGLAVYPQQRFQAALDLGLQQLPAGYSASYKTATYSWLDERATVSGVAVQYKGQQSFDVAIDEIVLGKPSLDIAAAWSKAVAAPTALAPDQVLPVVGTVDVRGIAAHGQLAVPVKGGATAAGTMTVSVESTHIDGLRLYPWALLHAGVPTIGEFLTATAAAGPQPALNDMLPQLRFAAALMLGVGYDGYALTNAQEAFKLDQTGTSPGIAVAYSMRRITDGAYDRGVIKECGVEGLTMTSAMTMPPGMPDSAPQLSGIPGTFGVDRVTMAGSDLRKPLTAVLEGDKLVPAMLDGLAIGRIEYAGMTLQPPGATAPVALGSIALSDIAFSQGLPISGRFAWDGIHVSRTQVSAPQLALVFDKLGLDSLTLSIEASYHWDLEQKRIAIRDTALKIDELGALDLSADLSNIEIGPLWVAQIRLAHALLHYKDATLTDRAFRIVAGQSGADPAAFRHQMIGQIEQGRVALGGDPARIAMSKAIVDFLTTPGSLTVELSPPSPVPLMTLQMAGAGSLPQQQLVPLIGLNISASP